MEKTSNFIFQGYHYLLETEKTICRIQASLCDPINADMLQSAVDAVMKHTDYFNLTLICENEQFYLISNDAPCIVYPGDKHHRIPEETNGYLFCVSYEGSIVFLDFWHFLTDGQGGRRFLNEILAEYCNRRYNEAIPCCGLYTSPPFSLAALKAQYTGDVSSIHRTHIPSMPRGETRRYLLRMDKDSVYQAALAQGMWPFSFLLYALSRFAQTEFQTDQISFGYTGDARDAIHDTDALYNCSMMYWNALDVSSGDIEELKAQIDEKVIESVRPAEKAKKLIQTYQVYDELYKMPKPLREKRMIRKMIARSSQAHFILSLMGESFSKNQRELKKHIVDYHGSMFETDTALFFTAITFERKMNLSCTDNLDRLGMIERLQDTLQHEGILVCDTESLD